MSWGGGETQEKTRGSQPTELSLANVGPVGVAHDEPGVAADFLWGRNGNRLVRLKIQKDDSCEVTQVSLMGVFTFQAY